MEVVELLLYVGAVWVLAAIGLFLWNVASRGHEHADRLAILPLEDNWKDEAGTPPEPAADSARKHSIV